MGDLMRSILLERRLPSRGTLAALFTLRDRGVLSWPFPLCFFGAGRTSVSSGETNTHVSRE